VSEIKEWRPFGIPPGAFEPYPRVNGVKIANVQLGQAKDRAAAWLRNAMIALAVLATAAAVVSWTAQFRMVFGVKHLAVVSALEAGIPDAGALIFACLGIALALDGKRAIRPRALNVGAVATSIAMNYLAAGHGWRDVAIWVMPPVAYALASDTLIGVIRAWALARQRALNTALDPDETTPLAIVGGLLLWTLRLALAPTSTLAGFRRWVLSTPAGPRPRELPATVTPKAIAPPKATTGKRPGPSGTRAGSKTARFIDLVTERHGDLAHFPVDRVSPVSAELAPEVDLNPGAARTALRKAVLAASNGSAS
jgi:hypothetical protein